MGNVSIIDMATKRPLLFKNFKIFIICECVYVEVRGATLENDAFFPSCVLRTYMANASEGQSKSFYEKKKFLTHKKLKKGIQQDCYLSLKI